MCQRFLNTSSSMGSIAALDSPMLDSSDFILLTMAILRQKLGVDIKPLYNDYINYNYAEVISTILKICKNHPGINKSPLYAKIEEAKERCSHHDNPKLNLSRRFAESQLAKKTINSLIGKDLESLTLWCTVKNKYTKGEHKDNIETVDSIEKAIKVISIRTNELGELADKVQEFKSATQITKLRDRGEKKDIVKSGNFLTFNNGIIKASSPNFCDNLGDELKKNRLVDVFTMDTKTPGFSADHKVIPFVSSVSGTIFELLILLEKFIIEFSSTMSLSTLQAHVNNIIKMYRSSACNRGFHSLGETLCVMTSPEVTKLFAKYGISIHTNFPKDAIAGCIEEAMEYSKKICLQALVHMQITRDKGASL